MTEHMPPRIPASVAARRQSGKLERLGAARVQPTWRCTHPRQRAPLLCSHLALRAENGRDSREGDDDMAKKRMQKQTQRQRGA